MLATCHEVDMAMWQETSLVDFEIWKLCLHSDAFNYVHYTSNDRMQTTLT